MSSITTTHDQESKKNDVEIMVNYDRRKREPDPFTEGSVQRDKLRVLDTDSSSKKDKGVL